MLPRHLFVVLVVSLSWNFLSLCGIGAEKNQATKQIRGRVLLVGIGDYSGSGDLAGAGEMADRLNRAFRLAGFPPDNVIVLSDEPGSAARTPPPTRDNVNWALRRIASEATEDDWAIVVLTGHGRFDAQGKLYFGNGDMLGVEEVHEVLSCSKAKNILLIVDTCRVFGDAHRPSPCVHPTQRTANCLALYACSPGESSWGHLFLANVATGLEGVADDDNDGLITVAELFEYARRTTAKRGLQNPVMEVRRGRADVAIARAPRSVREPQATISRMLAGPRCPHGNSYLELHVSGQLPDYRSSRVYVGAYLHHDDAVHGRHRTVQGDDAKLGEWMSLDPTGRFSGTVRLPCSVVNNPNDQERLLVGVVVWDGSLVASSVVLDARRPRVLTQSGCFTVPRTSDEASRAIRITRKP